MDATGIEPVSFRL